MKLLVCSVFVIAIFLQVKADVDLEAEAVLLNAKQVLQDLYDKTDEDTEYVLVQQNVLLDQFVHSAINEINLIENNYPDADQSPIVKKATVDIRKLVHDSRECVSKAAADAKDTVAKERKELKDGADAEAVKSISDRVHSAATNLPIIVEACKVGVEKALQIIVDEIKKMYH